MEYMYSEFAYSHTMQLILAVMTFIFTFVFIYLIANLVLQVFGGNASIKQKCIFAFLIGGVLNTLWVYVIYLIGGMHPFSELVYALVVNPNPIFAVLYYFIGIKVLKISPLRSIKLMGHVYLYYVIVQIFNRILITIFFVQSTERYNFMLDAMSQVTLFCVIVTIYWLTRFIIKHYDYTIKLNLFINFKKELAIYTIKAVVIYAMIVGLPLFISGQVIANIVIFSFFILVFILTNLWENFSSARKEIEYRDAHIRILLRENIMNHDTNISYLSKKITENPALVSILINKYEYAEKMQVKMSIELLSRLDDFKIDNIDICNAVSCLLDNAIEAAAESDPKRVFVIIDSKADGGMLIIIDNSASYPVDTNKVIFQNITTKKGHQGRGLAIVKEIVLRYGNCAFQMTYDDYKVSAYLETQ